MVFYVLLLSLSIMFVRFIYVSVNSILLYNYTVIHLLMNNGLFLVSGYFE